MSFKDSLLRLFVWKDLRKLCDRTIEINKDTKPKIIQKSNIIYHFNQPDIVGFFRVIEDSTHSISSACKTKVTEEMAKILGVEQICPDSELVKIPGYGIGLLQAACDGICIMTKGRNTRVKMLTPAFQRSINDLNLLDTVCHEADHSPNNYNVILDDQENAKAVVAFDNNGIGTFSMRSDISFYSFLKCSPFVTAEGTINRPYISAETVDALKRIRLLSLYLRLRKYIGFLPVFFIYRRIAKLKRAIRRTQKKNPELLKWKDEWNDATIQKELNGSWGKTYLMGFIYDC